MPLIVQRTYKLGIGSATDADAPASSASPLVVPSALEEHVTTRTCHRWSYVDALRHETCIVTLQAHYSLHVDVKGEGSIAVTSSLQQASGYAEGPSSDDGLCGFAWEFIWVPNTCPLPGAAGPAAAVTSSGDILTDETELEAQQPARDRFFFHRTTSLARSTLQGTGGVLFLSSRHVLVATETPEAAGAATGTTITSRGAPNDQLRDAARYGLMDSFVLSSGDAAAAARSSSRACSWIRVAASASLPCSFASPQAPRHASPTSPPSSRPSTVLLLVAGVPLQAPHHTSAAAAEVPLMRLVYVFAVPGSSTGGGSSGSADPAHRAWDVMACVADLCSSGASADDPHALQVRVRHAVALPMLGLSVYKASTEDGVLRGGGGADWGRARDGADGAHGTQSTSPQQQQRLDPHDILWAFVEDEDTRTVHPLRDGQLCGSLVALLPCCCAPGRALVAPPLPPAASSLVANSAPSPPAVLCMGFKGDTPYGALGVSSAELDSYAKANQQRQQRPGRASHSSVQEIIEQLLPSPERAVYELAVGNPTKCICPPATDASRATTAPTTALPAHTSLLMLIMDGIHTRGSRNSSAQQADASRVVSAPTTEASATALPQGLYLTETLSYDALAQLASSGRPEEAVEGRNLRVRIHHVPPTRTLWRGLDPLVLSVPTSAAGIMNDVWGDEDGTTQEMAQAAHRDVLAWGIDDVGHWMEWLSETANGSADGTCGKDHRTALVLGECAAAAEDTATSASPSSMATVTAVASYTCASSSTTTAASVVRSFPCFNELTHELTILSYCCNGAAAHSSEEEDQAATERAVALVRPPLWMPRTAASSHQVWEAHVAEWVAAGQVRRRLRSSTTPPSDAGVAAATYRAMRVLWAYAVLHEARPALPQWPHALMEVLRSTAADAAEHQTCLYLYARAVQTLTIARLASSYGNDTAKLETEVSHMRRAAAVFLRLVLRTLAALDWCAGDALGWMCCQWMVRWFLGSGAGATAAGATRSPSPTATATAVSVVQEQAAVVEGRAMQVLLQLGAAARESVRAAAASSPTPSPLPPLGWLRRALLLFACRNRQLPLELTVEDILEASGMLLQPETTSVATQATTVTSGWSEASDEEAAASAVPPWPTPDTAELRESMEYALLRLAKPEELYRVVHHLAHLSPATYLERGSAPTRATHGRRPRELQRLVVRGVLTVADLHTLVCAGWASGRPHNAAPPCGFTFVCYIVDVAMTFTSTVSSAAAGTVEIAEAYERLVIAALDTWGVHGAHEDGGQVQGANHARTDAADATDRLPVYPLLNTPELDDFATAAATTAVSAPFPFTLLAPLLTVYLWYHVTHRLCAALQLLPPATSEAAAAIQPEKTPGIDIADEQQHAPWLRRAKLRDGDQLQALHRGVCVLRCLTQEDPTAAEELFAAMRLVYSRPPRDSSHQSARQPDEHAGMGRVMNSTVAVGDTAAATASAVGGSWVSQYLIAWHHLLPLEAPPLCSAGALLAYQKRCCHAAVPTAPPIGDVMRVLHLVYASAGSGRALRGQVSRAMGLQQQVGREAAAERYAHSYAAFTRALQSWRAIAQKLHHRSTAKPCATASTMRSGGVAAADAIAAWLVQIWANVLLCDSMAVTDVGMYEHLFTALARAKQQGEQLSTTTVAAADVAFAFIRPCLLYALPALEQLAVEDELVSSSGHSSRTPAPAPLYPQYNEPLTWSAGGMTPEGAEGPLHGRAPERLCAGEVCERVRRQLRRLVALYDVPPSASPSTSSAQRGDVRFRTLAQLMALQPAAWNLAAAQRRVVLRSVKQSAARRDADGDDKSGQPSALRSSAASGRSPRYSSSSRSSSSSSAASFGDGNESTLELRTFFLSPAATYVAAAIAVAMHYTMSHTSARQDESSHNFPLWQSPSAAPPLSVGWFVVACEVLRRELRCYILEELRMNGYVEESAAMHAAEADIGDTVGCNAAEAAPHLPRPPVPRWRLVTSEAQLKAFINALADAVEPLTGALVQGMSFAVLQPLVLLLVLDVLHALLCNNAHTHIVEDAADGTTQRGPAAQQASTPVVMCADASILHLLRQWIHGVAAPLYQHMEDSGKKAVLDIVTDSFAREYLTAPRGEGGTTPSPGSTTPVSRSYLESDVHVEWRQWRNGAAARSVNGKGIVMLECLSACVAADHRRLVRLTLPTPSDGEAPQQAVSAVPPTGPRAKVAGRSSVDAAAAIGSTWLDVGSALRTSLFNTIGARVAPRSAHQRPQQRAQTSSVAVSLSHGEAQPASASTAEAQLPFPTPQPQAAPTIISGDSGRSRTFGLAVGGTDELHLLQREEAFKRRQCSEQLLREQAQLFATPAFQGSLLQLYVALRAEKRRRELMVFALDQHDLICALAHRAQQLRLDEAREALRRSWCEWGERQRLAVRRLLQEERDDRMGVQAVGYAAWSLLLDAERQERCVWVLYEEGRAGVMALEDDARDELALAAARAHLELTKLAAEAEEEAYWQAEEAAWARMQEEEQQETSKHHYRSLTAVQRQGGRMSSLSCASSSSSANSPGNPSNPPTVTVAVAHTGGVCGDGARVFGDDSGPASRKHVRRGRREGQGGDAAAVVALHSSLSGVGQREAGNAVVPAPAREGATAITSATAEQQQEVPPHSASLAAHSTHSEDEEDVVQGWGGGLAQTAVQSAISGTGGFFSTLSHWQTALRDTVAPPPPVRGRGRATGRQAAVSDAPRGSTAGQPSVVVGMAKEAAPPAPVVVPDPTRRCAAQADDWGWSSNSEKDTSPVEAKPPEWTAKDNEARAAMVVPLPSRGLAPLRKTSAGGEASVAAAAAAARPPRKKKGFAAATVLVEPVSSASAPIAPIASSLLLPPQQSVKQLRGQQQQRHASSREDPATPNPARNILSAIEAAAREVISQPEGVLSPAAQPEHAPPRSHPQGFPSLRVVRASSSESSPASGSSRHGVPSLLGEPGTLPSTATAAPDTSEGVEVRAGIETHSDPAAVGQEVDAGRAEDLESGAAAVDDREDWGCRDDDDDAEVEPGARIHSVQPAVGVGRAPAAAVAHNASSPPAPFAPSADAARKCHELRSRVFCAEPSPLPAASTIEETPPPMAGVEGDGWGWSDNAVHMNVVAEETRKPLPSMHLSSVAKKVAKDGWSGDDDSFGSDVAVPAGGTALSGALSPLKGPTAAPTTRFTILADFQEMYAAELEVRAQLVQLL